MDQDSLSKVYRSKLSHEKSYELGVLDYDDLMCSICKHVKASVNFLIQPKNCRSIRVENWIFTELTQEMYCNLLNFLRIVERRHLFVKAARS